MQLTKEKNKLRFVQCFIGAVMQTSELQVAELNQRQDSLEL